MPNNNKDRKDKMDMETLETLTLEQYEIYHDKMIHAADMMDKFGGSFAQALAHCIYHADDANLAKISLGWSDLIDEYHQMYIEIERKG